MKKRSICLSQKGAAGTELEFIRLIQRVPLMPAPPQENPDSFGNATLALYRAEEKMGIWHLLLGPEDNPDPFGKATCTASIGSEYCRGKSRHLGSAFLCQFSEHIVRSQCSHAQDSTTPWLAYPSLHVEQARYSPSNGFCVENCVLMQTNSEKIFNFLKKDSETRTFQD